MSRTDYFWEAVKYEFEANLSFLNIDDTKKEIIMLAAKTAFSRGYHLGFIDGEVGAGRKTLTIDEVR